jgi:hypothetical protein
MQKGLRRRGITVAGSREFSQPQSEKQFRKGQDRAAMRSAGETRHLYFH